jgi:signal recognition particle GTPase
MTENSIQPALRSVRRALLDADVNLDVATALIDGVKRRSLGKEVIEGVTAEQQFIKAMYDEVSFKSSISLLNVSCLICQYFSPDNSNSSIISC